MSKLKSERLINLLILLLSTRSFVSKHQIRQTIEGYRDQNDAAFERMFERDKRELRALGVPLQTGSNDPLEDEDDGYRILRAEFELPPLVFSPQELAVLGIAASVWQDSTAGRQTAKALETLSAAGAEPQMGRLNTLAPRLVAEPGFDEAWQGVLGRQEVQFTYRGEQRHVQPWRLLQRRGSWYLLGLDLGRDAPRRFKLSRVQSDLRLLGAPEAFDVPDPEVVDALADFASEPPVNAVVAIRRGTGSGLRRSARAAEQHPHAPAGFDTFEVTAARIKDLVAQICALGPDAVALTPVELVDAVVDQLSAVARGWEQ